jgi:hypothetical protein
VLLLEEPLEVVDGGRSDSVWADAVVEVEDEDKVASVSTTRAPSALPAEAIDNVTRFLQPYRLI